MRKEPQLGAPQKDDDDSDASDDDVRLEMPLGEGVLKVNLGIPLIVVVNKVDVLH